MSSIKRFLAVGSLVLMGAAAPVSYGDNHPQQPTNSKAMQKQQSASAQVVLQQDQQLSITIHTPLRNLFRYTQWPGKPAKMEQLANADDPQLESFRKSIRNLFRKDLKVAVSGKPMSAQKVRLPNLVQIKHALRAMYGLQERPMPPGNHSGMAPPKPNSGNATMGQHGKPDPMHANLHSQPLRTPMGRQASMMSRRDNVFIRVTGRIPEGVKQPKLEIQFPKAVGLVTASYSRPQIQKVKRGWHYVQPLN